ncbi:hypothetical protein Cgig2_013722 [Carnegiea gigantea]|uniref:Uncharacterized protein n=1 Tax=Carnegiea gigantea TaxID=171969 RepID=A0A9Q1QD30_9CARY|nr:hypothetical protein Cgig2_013722 [Carnegiea gigantea]
MASAYGFFSSSAPTYLKHRISSSIGQNGSGFSSYPGISKRVFCSTSSSIEGAVAPTELQVPRGKERYMLVVDVDLNAHVSGYTVSKGCKLVGCGSAVPQLQISNDDLASIVDTSDEWIATRTGIRKRHVLSGEDSLVGLATEAAQKALQMAQVDPDDIDLVLMCSSTPEDLFGSAPQAKIICMDLLFCLVSSNVNPEPEPLSYDVGPESEAITETCYANVQRALGCSKNPLSYDITAACSGFLLGLLSAACHVRGGGFKNVLVIGADGLSRFVDWSDKRTCILFGDAAGAVVVQACNCEEDGLFAFDVHSDGDGIRHLNASLRHDETNGALVTNGSVAGFPPRRPAYSCINMNGKEVFRFAVRCVPLSIEAALEKAGLSVSNIDWLLLHQAKIICMDLLFCLVSSNVNPEPEPLSYDVGPESEAITETCYANVQRALGCSKNPLSYDITAACSGFLLGLLSAACHVRGGGFKNVLVIGADGLSRFVDWSDKRTCILFGDAAGAVVVQACNCEEDGLFAFDVHSDGDGIRHLNASLRHDETNGALVTNGSVAGFPPRRPAYSCINMNGKEVFRFAVRCVPLSIEAALEKAGLSVSNIDWLLLHQGSGEWPAVVEVRWGSAGAGDLVTKNNRQVMIIDIHFFQTNNPEPQLQANQRIIDAVATRLELPPERVISNLAQYGNTSAASIPLALDEAVRRGDVKPGHIIAASGFGAGLTWGSAILRWG